MEAFGVSMFVAGFFVAFDLLARNTVTGETRVVTVHARDAMAAFAQGFSKLDAESGDRSWCFDGFDRRES